jgi:hypothetical protein
MTNNKNIDIKNQEYELLLKSFFVKDQSKLENI